MKKNMFQILIVTTNRNDTLFLKKMNVTKNAIICNQCNSIGYIENNQNVKMYNYNDKGVGKNRNHALMNATSDIALLADDDITYYDNYEEIICESFFKYKNADVLIFNLEDSSNERYIIKKSFKVNYYNFMRFGAVRIAFKVNKVKLNTIYFNEFFGGGCKYSHGEDTLFLKKCLDANLKIYAIPLYIGIINYNRPSTWNVGYNDKYFSDQGKLYKCITPRFWKLLCIQDTIRHRKTYKSKHVLKKMIEGGKQIEI